MKITEVKLSELRNHPKQFLFADVSGGDWKEFVQSIRDDGIQQPLILSDRTDERVIVDGHQRYRAAGEVGLRSLPVIVRPFADEREEVGVMIASNIKRRSLTRKQKAAVIEEYIKLYAERSDNWIAEDLGLHNETVTAKREELEEKGQLTETVSLQGKDGKIYPRKRPKPKVEPEPETVGLLLPRFCDPFTKLTLLTVKAFSGLSLLRHLSQPPQREQLREAPSL